MSYTNKDILDTLSNILHDTHASYAPELLELYNMLKEDYADSAEAKFKDLDITEEDVAYLLNKLASKKAHKDIYLYNEDTIRDLIGTLVKIDEMNGRFM